MSPRKTKINPTLTLALEAVANLCEAAFLELDSSSITTGIVAHSEIQQRQVFEKSRAFFGSFLPLREQMIELIANTFRRYFRLGLAHPSQTGDDPENWAWLQLQPAVHASLEWMRDWYILACDGESRRLRHIATVELNSGITVSTPFSNSSPSMATPWRAPSWLFQISGALFGIGLMKKKHIPDRTDDRLGPAHTRLLLTGAKRVFLRHLAAALEKVRNEEILAAGEVREGPSNQQKRPPNKRKGWQQREKLYTAIRKVLAASPKLQGIDFCAELDKRHAPPHWEWVKTGEWRQGLTWKEAWQIPELQRKIRRVRQEAQKKG